MKKKLIALTALAMTNQAYSLLPLPFELNKTKSFHSKSISNEIDSISVDELLSRQPLQAMSIGTKNQRLELLETVARMQNEALAQKTDGFIKIAQKHQGLPVFASELIFNIKNGKVKSIDGRISSIETTSILPSLSENEAKNIASDLLGYQTKFDSQLTFYPMKDRTVLAWHLEQDDVRAAKWTYFIDASNGEVIRSFNSLATGFGASHDEGEVELESTFNEEKKLYFLETSSGFARKTHDVKNKGSIFFGMITGLPGELANSENDLWYDQSTVDAHYYSGQFLKFLKEKFNRNSYDDKGATVIASVHFMKKFVNAFWTGKQIVFGDGDDKQATSLVRSFDVMAHELSHAVTTHTSDLVYANESGALNEAFSDIIATYAEYIVQPTRFDWIIGEDCWTPGTEGDGLRYMNDPSKNKSDDPNLPERYRDLYSRDFYADRYQGTDDGGGVHINSGIANLAFYLLSEGGLHPRGKSDVNVKGIGIDQAAKIFYNTFTKRLTKNATFKDARVAMEKEALEISEEMQKAVADAWSAVGVI